MPTVEEFAEIFPNEQVLQQALSRLLSKIPDHTGVQILQGSRELGKDIIFYTPGPFGQKDLNACVVKNTKITGSASTKTGARTVFNQAQQALDTPLLDENGHEQRVRRVFIITPHPIQPETVISIIGALHESEDRVQFIGGTSLLEKFTLYWPEYLAEEFTLIRAYVEVLTETAAGANELQGLSFQYQLGAVDTSIKRIYVPTHFRRLVPCYSLCPLLEDFPKAFHESFYSSELVESITSQLESATNFLATVTSCGLCDERDGDRARSACTALIREMTGSLKLVSAARAARAQGITYPKDSPNEDLVKIDKLAQLLDNIDELHGLLRSAEASVPGLSPLLRSAKASVDRATRNLKRSLTFSCGYVKRGLPESDNFFSDSRENAINRLDEIARISGPRYMVKEGERCRTLTSEAMTKYPGSLLIIAPAGFGKTSFCRWHVLSDLDKLSAENSDTLPVYVPLHQVGSIEDGDFKSIFLRHAGVSGHILKGNRAPYNKVRVYLDGLDEVADHATQRRILEIVRAASKADPTLQLIITARDYAYETSTPWLTRLRLSGFDEMQVKELATKWLENDGTKISRFLDQLEKSSSLKEMATTPLLATLILLVFKQTGKLPENKTRLYEIFVDLHNGGWDLVKNIQRPSRYSAAEKKFVLKRIAANAHKAMSREMREADVETVARETFNEIEWSALRDELLRDGLIVQFTTAMNFAHHSYQEFLTACYLLGGFRTDPVNSYCEEYLKGLDWWRDVLGFYIDLVGRPLETQVWLDERLRAVCKHSNTQRVLAEERAQFLRQHLERSFPFARK